MSRSVVILRKKALVLGISSVLAGWSGSGGLCAEELDVAASVGVKPAVSAVTANSGVAHAASAPAAASKWPPDAQMVIDSTSETAIDGITIENATKNISLQTGTLEIPADITIGVTGSGPNASIVGTSGTNTLNNSGTVSVGEGATGVSVLAGELTIEGAGSIKPASNAKTTTGVSVAEVATLSNSSKIAGSKAAIEITGGNTVNFQSGSVVTGSTTIPAINASTAKNPVTLNIDSGTFTGDVLGGESTTDTINLTATTGGGILGNIIGFQTINIKGTDWTVQSWISGVNTLTTSATIDNLQIDNSQVVLPGSPELTDTPSTLKVSTKTSSGPLPLEVVTDPSTGAIGNLSIYGAAKITATDPITVENISFTYPGKEINPTSGWTFKGWVSGVKTLSTSETINDLYVNNVVPDGEVENPDNTATLRVASSSLAVTTVPLQQYEGDIGGVITTLNISGTPTLTAAAPITVGNIAVNNSGWTFDGWATGVESLTTSSAITQLDIHKVLPATPVIPLQAEVQTDTLHVVVAAAPLAVTTKAANGAITAMNATGDITLTAAEPIKVTNIVVNSGSSLALNAPAQTLALAPQNWATGVSSLTTSSVIPSLNVNSASASNLPNALAASLNINSSSLAVATNSDAEGAAGSITTLNIAGTPTLTAAAPINVENIVIGGEKSSLALNNWATGVTSLDTSSVIPSLNVNNLTSEELTSENLLSNALNVNSSDQGVTITTPNTGAITNLNISGTPKLIGSGPITVNNIEVNDSGWTVSPQLNDVKTVTANSPTPAPASQEPVINTISLNSPSVRSGSGNATGTLYINAPISANPIKIAATEPGLIAAVNVGNDAYVDSITNAKTINITGSGWDFEGLVTNPEKINVSGKVTAINSAYSGTTVGSDPGTLNVAFDQQADVNGYLNISGPGTISNIDFSTVVNRPSLMYTPSGKVTVANIEGNSAKADTIVLTNMGSLPEGELPKGFTGIEYPAPPDKIAPDLKRLGLGGIADGTTITTILNAPPDEDGGETADSKPTISIPFTASGMPSAFYLKTSGGSYSIDFSSADRPTTTFEIAGGTITSLKNVAALNDQLIITKGNLPNVDIASMSTLSINGSGWSAPGTFSNLNSLDITSTGDVNALNVSSLPLSKPPGATLNVLTTSAQQLPVTIVSGGKLAELHASDGANLGAIDVGGTLGTIIANTGASLGAIDVGGVLSELNANTGSSFGVINVASGGELQILNATESTLGDITIADSGILTTLNATGSTLGAITVAEGGTLSNLNANKGTTLGDIVGAQTVTIADGASLGAITNATTVNISGVATTLGPITNAGTVNAGSLAFEQVQVGSGLPAGANIGSTSGQNLVLNTPTNPVNLTTKGIGTLTLGSGAQLGATIGGVNNLAITGSDWSAGTVPMTPDAKGTATVNIGAGVEVAGITVAAASAKATTAPQPLSLTITPTTGAATQTLAVTTSGSITGNLNFSGLPKGTTVNLEEAGGTIEGQITGVKNVTFSGISNLEGTIGQLSDGGSVNIKGQLTSLSTGAATMVVQGQKASFRTAADTPSPIMNIAPGGKLIINRKLEVASGGYNQDGTIEVDLTSATFSRTSETPPLVTADTITIGPDATLEFDSTNTTEGQVLMKATEQDINRPVTIVDTFPGTDSAQYNHFYATLTSSDAKSSDKKLMTIAAQPMQTYICDMASAGGAPASAVRAVDVAVAPKNSAEAAAARSRTRITGDPLNTFVVQRASTPASAAQLAKQLTPNDTGSNITATRGAQHMASKAIDDRNTNRRTGMNTGDMVESGGVWIQYAYNNAKQDEKDGVSGYKDKTNGFTLGADWELDPMFDAGVAYTYAKSDISGEGAGSGSNMDSKNHIFTLYGSYAMDDMFMDGLISYASADNKGNRNLGTSYSYDSKSWGFGLSGGITLPASEEWSWQPLVAFNYYRITTDDYSESASSGSSFLAFDSVKNDDYTIMELGAGVRLMGDIESADLAFRPAFKLMAFHDFKDDPVTMTAHYAAGGSSFLVQGAKRDTTRFQFVASVDVDLQDNMMLSFNYSHDWMDNFKSDGFIARLRYDF